MRDHYCKALREGVIRRLPSPRLTSVLKDEKRARARRGVQIEQSPQALARTVPPEHRRTLCWRHRFFVERI
jgi:hypothetical protein